MIATVAPSKNFRVVVAAGGHVNLQSTPLGDSFVAFALPAAAK